MDIPLITIGIATFNALNTIEKSISSALKQSWENFEIIIVDDCSIDGTYEFLKKLSNNNNKISLFRNSKNFGIGYVRNKIISKAAGEFIAFFDDDDESLSNRLELQYKRIIEYEKKYSPEAPVLCHSSRKVYYPNGKIKVHPTIGTNLDTTAPFGISVARRILLGKPLKDGYGSCPTCSQMARISSYKILGGFDTQFRRSEDTDFCIKHSLLGSHFVGIRNPLVKQIMTLSEDKNIEIEFSFFELILDKYKYFIKANGNYKFCHKWLRIKYFFSKRNFLKLFLLILLISIRYPKETFQRLILSIRSIGINNDFATFHNNKD